MSETTTSIVGKCAHCGEKISCGSLFCSHECKENFDRRKQLDVLKHQYKSQKHEEIKQIALGIYKGLLLEGRQHNNLQTIKQIEREEDICFEVAWEQAEKFYNFAKEKEEEK